MLRRDAIDSDRGDTLIETMIVMIIFTLILGIVSTAIITMMKQVDKQSGLADNLGNARKTIETLDNQVRFANAISTPGTSASGDLYVEFQSLATNVTNQPQVCTQWRYHAANSTLQYRTWQVPTTLPATVTPTGWITEAAGISAQAGTPIFGLDQSAGTAPHQSLDVTMVTSNGNPPNSSTSQVTITAINSLASNSTNSTVCQQAGRP